MMLNDIWFVFSTMGEMNLKDILNECQNQSWVPLLIVRTNEEVLIPYFYSQENAIKFAKRNLPKNQIFGTTILTENDIEILKENWVNKKGWKLQGLNHPRLMKDLGKFDVEVFEFSEKPDVYGTYGSKCQENKLLTNAHTLPK